MASFLTRFEASEWKATYRQSDEMAGLDDTPLAAPFWALETSVAAPVMRSRRKTSVRLFVSLETMLVALELKAT